MVSSLGRDGSCLREHPKSKNLNYDAHIRATIYENKDQYVNHSSGLYELNYAVA